MEAPELSPKQQRFCEEYVIDHNAVQAAIRAGYAKTTALAKSAQWLEKVGIKTEIAKLEKRHVAKCRVDAQWVIDQIASIAQNENVSARDRLKALEMLAKHHQLFEKKDESDTKIEVVIGDEAREWLV